MIKIIVPILILIMLIPFSLLAFTPESELFSEAESRYYSKNYAVAIELYDEFLKAFPLSDLVPDAQYRKAVCLFRLERYSASRTLFDAVERRYRATRYIDYVPFWKGVILYKLADFSGSRNNLESFLKKVYDPDLVSQALLYKAL
ncbi:MAG: tetratricopeptide repeat protein, partial [Spirochaetes bacterium]|nr:tetratricopeptide repeat protein [Spirochaetota bacterium]